MDNRDNGFEGSHLISIYLSTLPSPFRSFTSESKISDEIPRMPFCACACVCARVHVLYMTKGSCFPTHTASPLLILENSPPYVSRLQEDIIQYSVDSILVMFCAWTHTFPYPLSVTWIFIYVLKTMSHSSPSPCKFVPH